MAMRMSWRLARKVHAIDGRHRHEGIALVLQLAFAVAFADHIEFASQHFGEEVAIAACGFEEAAVDALGLLLDHIEHGVNLTLVGEHLAVFLRTLSGLDLLPFCHSFCSFGLLDKGYFTRIPVFYQESRVVSHIA